MATNLNSLSIQALDTLNKISSLQELLEIYLEQGEQPLEKRASRADLLVSSYVDQVEIPLAVLERNLEAIRELIATQD